MHIFSKSIRNEEGEILTTSYEVEGYSGINPIYAMQSRWFFTEDGLTTMLEQDRIPVYDCVDATVCAYFSLQESSTKPSPGNAIRDYKFSVKLPTKQSYNEFLKNIMDAVALWRDEGWRSVCNENPGHVYILQKSFPSVTYPVSELAFTIEGSSGRKPTNPIKRAYSETNPGPVISEKDRFPVSSCTKAVDILVKRLNTMSSRASGIKNKEGYGDNTFFVKMNAEELFFDIAHHASFPLLSTIPPIDWLSCEEKKSGYLYIARISAKKTGKYYCDRIFGSSEEIRDSNYVIEQS